MLKINIKKAVATFMVGVALSTGVMAYAAGVYQSTYTYRTVGGYSYKDCSYVYYGNGATARTEVGSSNGTTIPVGYMGVQAILWKSDGTLAQCSSLAYNQQACTSVTIYSPTTNVSGTYFSRGTISLQSGSGFYYYSTSQTQNITQ